MIFVSSGVTSSGVVVTNGTLNVLNGGRTVSARLGSGGFELVSSGGASDIAIVSSGGYQIVLDGGIASGATVQSGGYQSVSGGGVASGTEVSSGGVELVFGTGSAVNTHVEAGGFVVVLPNAVVTGATGAGTIMSTGVAAFGISGQPFQHAATTATGWTIATGGTADVLSLGVLSAATLSGGEAIVYSGGVASGTTVGSAGILRLSAGSAAGTVIRNGGFEFVSSGGIATGETVSHGGQISVGNGGLASGALVSNGGTLVVFVGGVANQTSIASGGTAIIYGGAIASATTIGSGGFERVSGNGNTFGTLISSGGIQTLSAGGLARGTIVRKGGMELVLSAGVASGIIVSLGGIASISAGGSALQGLVGAGGYALVSAGGVASGLEIGAAGVAILSAGAVASSLIVDAGGVLIVQGGASNLGATGGGLVASTGVVLMSAGQAPVNSASTDARILGIGSREFVLSAGIDTNAVLTGGLLQVLSGGVASATAISAGGSAIIGAGGTLRAGSVFDGGVEVVTSLGLTSGAILFDDGLEVIAAGGVASSTIVSSGGAQLVSGGVAVGTQIASGGVQGISAGGVASTTHVSSGAVALVLSGGTASATNVDAGGYLVVLSGATASTTTGAGAVISTGIILVDLGGGSFQSGVMATGLTVAANFVAGALAGGTLTNTIVTNGGWQVVQNNGTATGTVINSGGLETIYAGATTSGTTLQAGGTIDLQYLTPGADPSASYNSVTHTLLVSGGNGTFSEVLAGSYTSQFFHATDDGNGGTFITADSLPCFLRGTRIATVTGEQLVEDLRAGDTVATEDGPQAVRWVGFGRALVTARNRSDVAPVIIRAGALGPNSPHRDLFVTRHHAMRIGDVLVPAEHLVNGRSIVWDNADRVIEYYHIELDRHAVLCAEGAPAESFRDEGSAHLFQNRDDRPMLGLVAARLPIITGGAALDAAWLSVAARAGVLDTTIIEEADPHLLIDGVRVDACWRDGTCWHFDLPAQHGQIILASRSIVPAIDGRDADRRRLGIAVRGILYGTRDRRRAIALGDVRLEGGWHPAEHDHRWTKGEAMLPPSGWRGGAHWLQLDIAETSLPYRPMLHAA